MNYYAEAIGIITNNKENSYKILAEIAKANPSAVVKGYKNLMGLSWQPEAIRFLKSDKKIQAIKHCRSITGLGLKEAKEAVESLHY